MKLVARSSVLVACAAACLAIGACGEGDARAPESRSSAAQQRGLLDPNGENPDPAYVDLAGAPFRPEMVGGRFVRVQEPPSTLNAVARVSEDAGRLHKYFLGAPLLMESPDLRGGALVMLPWAAARLPEESADGLTQTWTLRPDVSWEDGRPVSSKDYAFTLARLRDPEVNARTRDTFVRLAKIEEVDARTFRTVWASRSFRDPVAFGLDFPLVPEHASPKDARAFNAALTHLACGPYRVAAYTPSRVAEFVLRDEYRKAPFPPRPIYLERFVVEKPADPAQTWARVLNGEAHMAQLDFERFKAAAADEAFRRVAWRAPVVSPSYSFIAWNTRDPADPGRKRPHRLFGDVRVRRAMSRLIDLDAINLAAFSGLAVPASGPFLALDPGSDPAARPRAFDPAAAARLLAEAGFAKGADGVLIRGADRCAFTLTAPNVAMPPYNVLPAALQEEGRKIGVAIEIDKPDFRAVLEAGKGRKFDAIMMLWQTDPVEPDVAPQFRSDFAQSGDSNWSGFADPETDRILDAVAAARDAGEGARLRRDLHRRLLDQVPWTFLFQNRAPVAISRAFANLRVHDLGIRFHDLVARDLWEKFRPR